LEFSVVPRNLSGRPLAAVAGLVVVATIAVAGCSSSKSRSSGPTSAPASAPAPPTAPASPVPLGTNATAIATVSGAFGTAPTIKLTGAKAPSITQVSVITRGTGTVVQVGDLAVVDDYGRTLRSATTFQNTFTSAEPPDTLPVGTGSIELPGLDRALVGVPVGSRVLVVLPPAAGFANVTSTLPTGVSKTDTAVLVFDVKATFAGDAGPSGAAVSTGGGGLPTVSSGTGKPTITIPKSPAPTALSSTILIQGTGPVTETGQELVVQYLGQIWATGKEFDSSWSRDIPAGFTVGVGDLIPAWDKELVGVKVGSRVLLVVPPADGYGSAGQSDAGISATDTLVFVVDILAAFSD
jgi:FKBP-type peptidyl-prolyl cis-trans isomerase